MSPENCVHPWMDNFFGLRHLCEPYVDILRNWTPVFEWYVARFVVKTEHQKKLCKMMRLDYELKLY